jgi:hypothetical protein
MWILKLIKVNETCGNISTIEVPYIECNQNL